MCLLHSSRQAIGPLAPIDSRCSLSLTVRSPVKALLMLATLAGLCSLSACITIPGAGGTKHHIIFGFGIVSVNECKAKSVIATDTHAIGISISGRPGLKCGIGISSSTVVTVPHGADDVRVEVSKLPWGPLIIEADRVRFQNFTRSKKGEVTHEY